MRKVSTLVGLTLLALAGPALAQDEAPAAAPAGDTAAAPAPAPEAAAAPAAAPASDSKMQAGINFIPVLLGKMKTDAVSADAAFGYGFGLTFGYAVIPGLYVGVAPQLLLGLKPKDNPLGVGASKAIDILARVAYVYTVMPKLGVYAKVLPGYSIILPPEGDKPKGFVIAGGVGAMYDVTDQIYLNLGVGYEYGLQKADSGKSNFSFLRIAVGAGMKF